MKTGGEGDRFGHNAPVRKKRLAHRHNHRQHERQEQGGPDDVRERVRKCRPLRRRRSADGGQPGRHRSADVRTEQHGMSVGAIEGTSPSADMPSLQPSRSIDERLLGAGATTTGRDLLLPSPVSALKPLVSGPSLGPSGSTFIHPLTGKPLDPSSPLALALAARERALASQAPSRSPTPVHSPDTDRPGPLFVDVQARDSERGPPFMCVCGWLCFHLSPRDHT